MKDDDENEVRLIFEKLIINHIYEICSRKHQFQHRQLVDHKRQSMDNQLQHRLVNKSNNLIHFIYRFFFRINIESSSI